MLVALTLLALVAVAIWVALPLLKRQPPERTMPFDDTLNDLLEAKYAVFRSILDLEFDRKMEKVSEEDYAIMRAQHEAEALQILAETENSGLTTDTLEREIAAARDRLRK